MLSLPPIIREPIERITDDRAVTILALLVVILFGAAGFAGLVTGDSTHMPSEDFDTSSYVLEEDITAGEYCDPVDCWDPDDETTATSEQHGDSTSPLIGVVTVSPETGILLATYSRWNDVSPLDHELREDIQTVVEQAPGVTLPEITEQTSDSRSTVRYHIDILQRENLIQKTTIWGIQRVYPITIDTAAFEAHAAIQDATLAGVLAAIARNPRSTVSALAKDLDRSPSTVSHHLSRLEEVGLIERERSGQSVTVELEESVDTLLDQKQNREAAGSIRSNSHARPVELSDD